MNLGTKILKTRISRPSRIQGCIVDQDSQRLAGAQIDLSYQTSIVLERQREFSDSNGCFDIQNVLPYFNVIIAEMNISKIGYSNYSTLNNSDFPYGGLPLIVDQDYTFTKPVILRQAFAQVNIFGSINNQYKQPLAGVQIVLYVRSSDEQVTAQSEPVVTSGNGMFVWQAKLEFRAQYSVTIQTSKKGYSTIFQTFALFQSDNKHLPNDFSHECIIEMTPPRQQGSISGTIMNKLRHPIQTASITTSVMVNQDYSYQLRAGVNQNGQFVLRFSVY